MLVAIADDISHLAISLFSSLSLHLSRWFANAATISKQKDVAGHCKNEPAAQIHIFCLVDFN